MEQLRPALGREPEWRLFRTNSFCDQTLHRRDPALEDREFWLLLDQPFELGGLEGGCFARDPGHNPGLQFG